MSKKDGTTIIKMIALKEGVSVDEVRRSIQETIDMGLTHLTPKVREAWYKHLERGYTPTPENLVLFLAVQTGRRT